MRGVAWHVAARHSAAQCGQIRNEVGHDLGGDMAVVENGPEWRTDTNYNRSKTAANDTNRAKFTWVLMGDRGLGRGLVGSGVKG